MTGSVTGGARGPHKPFRAAGQEADSATPDDLPIQRPSGASAPRVGGAAASSRADQARDVGSNPTPRFYPAPLLQSWDELAEWYAARAREYLARGEPLLSVHATTIAEMYRRCAGDLRSELTGSAAGAKARPAGKPGERPCETMPRLVP